MFSAQREARRSVVKLGFFPVVFAVAALALDAQRALVHVVLFVTGVAFVRGLAEFLLRRVTFRALDLLVLAVQLKFGERVIELLLIESCDPAFSALVLGMATATGLRFALSVKAGLVAHVSTHRLVAIHAQTVLRLAVEPDVALLAVVLPFGVALNQLPRRDHGLDALRPGNSRAENSQQQADAAGADQAQA